MGNRSFGEENGWRCKEEYSDFIWVLDPIDGTKSFITGNACFFSAGFSSLRGKFLVTNLI